MQRSQQLLHRPLLLLGRHLAVLGRLGLQLQLQRWQLWAWPLRLCLLPTCQWLKQSRWWWGQQWLRRLRLIFLRLLLTLSQGQQRHRWWLPLLHSCADGRQQLLSSLRVFHQDLRQVLDCSRAHSLVLLLKGALNLQGSIAETSWAQAADRQQTRIMHLVFCSLHIHASSGAALLKTPHLGCCRHEFLPGCLA